MRSDGRLRQINAKIPKIKFYLERKKKKYQNDPQKDLLIGFLKQNDIKPQARKWLEKNRAEMTSSERHKAIDVK